jgi:hypothetical protein
MKNIFVLSILLILLACSKGGPGSGGVSPKTESQLKNEYTKLKDISTRDYLNVLNAIPILKGRASFSSVSNLEFKQGLTTCLGNSDLKISFDKELKRFTVFRKVTKVSGSCRGVDQLKNYKTSVDLNLGFLYKIAASKNVKISEGTYEGKTAYSISNEEKDQTTIYLLCVKGELLDSLQSEYIYKGNDAYTKISTKIYPAADSKIEGNLIEDNPETGDILELSEFPLYDLIT